MTGVGTVKLPQKAWVVFLSRSHWPITTDCDISQGQDVGFVGPWRISLMESSIHLPLD